MAGESPNGRGEIKAIAPVDWGEFANPKISNQYFGLTSCSSAPAPRSDLVFLGSVAWRGALIVGVMHHHMNIRTFSLIWFFLSALASAEDRSIADLFAKQGVNGTIVVSSLRGGEKFIHNDRRAAQQFSPASTFKILNTLISLEERVISGKGEVLRWDGQVHELPDWNRDQTLESAFKVSCVWCFQQMARKVGAEKYRDYLSKTAYGDLQEPFEVTTFWLDGALKVSALEQVTLLKKIYQRTLPFSESSYEGLRDVMLAENADTYVLRAKTGWAARMTPQVGWYVGYVEKSNDVWFFATNIEIRNQEDLPLRQKITREALQIKGIIE